MLGELISAGSSLLGGLFGSNQADKSMQLQKDAMKKGIQWRVADAKKAGVHPLYALGAPTFSPSPVSTGYDMGSALHDMGQDVSRAVMANGTAADRSSATLQKLALERAGLENDLLRAQIVKTAAPQVGPPRPSVIKAGGSAFPVDPSSTPAQEAQNEWGEPAEWYVGGLNMLRSHDAALGNWFRDTFGVDMNQYTPSNLFAYQPRKKKYYDRLPAYGSKHPPWFP